MKKLIPILFLFFACKHDITPIQAKSKDHSNTVVTVNVKDYGAKGNGTHDDYPAFQAAEDYLRSIGGGVLYVPAGTYKVSQAFYHRNNVTLQGDGNTSIIKNSVTSPTGSAQFCIYIGNFMPTTYAECKHYDANAVTAGATQVTLVVSSKISNFYLGQAILIDSKSGFTSADGHWKPYKAFINRVVGLNSNTGTITLEDAITTDIPDIQVAPTNKFTQTEDTNKIYICVKPVIQNIRFESKGDWAERFGVYKGLFQNISMQTTDVIPGNGFSYCTWKNINATFSQKVIEMAMYSHNSTVDSLTATWWNGAADPAQKPLLKMGENQRDCSYSHLTINSGTAAANFDNVIRYDHAFNDTIRNSNFTCTNVDGAGVSFDGGDVNTYIINNNVLNNTFTLGGGKWYIEFQYNGATVTGNVVNGNTFSGHVNQEINGSIGSNTVTNNTYLH